MPKLVAVAWREFLATIRTKAFVLSVLLMPGLIIVSALGAGWAQQIGQAEQLPLRRLAVLDQTAVVFDYLAARVAAHNAERPQQPIELVPLDSAAADEDALRARVLTGDLYGYLVRIRAYAGQPYLRISYALTSGHHPAIGSPRCKTAATGAGSQISPWMNSWRELPSRPERFSRLPA